MGFQQDYPFVASLDYVVKSSVSKQDKREREKGRRGRKGEGREKRREGHSRHIKCANMQLLVIHYSGTLSSSFQMIQSSNTMFKCWLVA